MQDMFVMVSLMTSWSYVDIISDDALKQQNQSRGWDVMLCNTKEEYPMFEFLCNISFVCSEYESRGPGTLIFVNTDANDIYDDKEGICLVVMCV